MRMLYFTHSGLRYLVLLAGVVALLYFIYAVATRKGNERAARIVGATFIGLLDLQIVIGLILVALGIYYPALLGHLFMMIAAAVIGHVGLAMGRSAATPERAAGIRLMGVAFALLLIMGGILSIGRSVLGAGPPSM